MLYAAGTNDLGQCEADEIVGHLHMLLKTCLAVKRVCTVVMMTVPESAGTCI